MRSKRMMSRGLCLAALAGLLAAAGCNGAAGPDRENGTGEGRMVKGDNAVCPIMNNPLPGEGVPATQTRHYEGKTVGFCCPPCAPKWDGLPAAEKDALMAKMFPASASAGARVINTTCPIMGTRIDPASVPPALVREFGGSKIGFCCAGCPSRWDALPDAKKSEIAAKFTGGE